MKKFIIFFFLLLIVPSFVFSVNNAKINGQKEIVITQLPTEIVFTCDLAQAGNKLTFEYYIDLNGDGEIGPLELESIMEFYYITDGIGWIRDPEDPNSDFAGDESIKDGKLKSTFVLEEDDAFIPISMTGHLRLVDEDGSTDMVKITLQIQPQPPFIQGRVTDASNGAPIQGAIVFAINDDEDEFGAMTDNNGDYVIPVDNGTYIVTAIVFPFSKYQPADTIAITVSNDQSQTQDFALQPYTSFVNGKLTMENGTPVPGIMVLAITGGFEDPGFGGSVALTDAQGNYSLGVLPGPIKISPAYMFNLENKNWPQNHYVEPQVDSLNVAEGQTLISDFVFKSYTAFISGKCTADGAGFPNVEIMGMAFDLTTGSMNFYQTLSDQNGDYQLGVLPGTITMLSAQKDGYTTISPAFGGVYMNVTVTEGQTVSGKDFGFELDDAYQISISGTVTFNDGSAASNVYVAAENYWEESPEGFLITYTDGSGNYLFENVLDGDYQVGVYYEGYSSIPPMRYFDLWGWEMTGQDFVLSQGTGVESKDRNLKPLTIKLAQNFPNPFNPTTTISFDLPAAAQVEVNIFNAAGQKIRTLVNSGMNAGTHQIEWEGRNDTGQKVTSGVYLYQLKTNNYAKVMKMILAK